MTLFLGHPTYALSVVLFGLLIFAGLGSYEVLLTGAVCYSGALLLLQKSLGSQEIARDELGDARGGGSFV